MEKIPPEVISTHRKGKKAIWNSQYGFTRGKFCLTNIIAFYNEMAGWLGKGSCQYSGGQGCCLEVSKQAGELSYRNFMKFKDKCESSTWDRITPCNSTSLALPRKHSCRKMPGDAGEQVERESAIFPSSGEGMTYEKTDSCVCSGPLKKGKGRNNCCTQLHVAGYRENGARGCLEVHSEGLRGN